MKKIITITCLLLLSTSCAFISADLIAQSSIKDLSFKKINTKSGLSSDQVNHVFRDSLGYLWVYADGVFNKYNGYSFSNYTALDNNNIPLNEIVLYDMIEDSEHSLYLATSEGIVTFNRQFDHFSLISLNTNRKDQAVFCIISDRNNTLWAIGKQIFKQTDKDEFNAILDLEKTDSVTVATYNKGKHLILLGTDSGRILQYDINQNELSELHVIKQNGNSVLPSDRGITDMIYEASSNLLWVALKKGIIKKISLTDKISEQINLSDTLHKGNSLTAMYSFNDTSLWVGTAQEGIVAINKNTLMVDAWFTHTLQNLDGISGNEIMDFNSGIQHIVWIATNDGGVSYYDPAQKAFRHYTQNPYAEKTFSNNAINDITTSKQNNAIVYLATDKGGLNIFNIDNESIKIFEHNPMESNSLGSNNTITVAEEPSGNLWVTAWAGGLNYVNPNTGEVKTYWYDANDPYSIPGNNSWTVLCTQDNEVWAGFSQAMAGGLARYDRDNDRFIRYPSNAGNLGPACDVYVSMYEDTQGYLWFGSQSCGLEKYDRNTGLFTNYGQNPADSNALNNGVVNDIIQDLTGRLWLATGGGLHEYIYETDNFKRYNSEFGLPTSNGLSVQVDEKNTIWMGTTEGLYHFNPETGEVNHYTKDDGLQSKQFKANAADKNSRGQLFFGGINGFNIFRPSEINDNTFIPKIVFTGLLFDNQKITYKDKKSPLKKDISETDKIVLSPAQSTFGVEFAALNLSNPDKNTYKYQLIGLNDSMVDIGEQHAVYFNNLAAGNYTLKVIGSNNDGYTNTNGTELDIKIRKKFQNTLFFYFLLGLAVVFLIIVYQRFRKKQHQIDKKHMAKLLEKEKKLFEDQKAQVIFQKQAVRSLDREDFELKWTNTGIARYSSITSKYRNNLNELSQRIITFIVDYIEADQGEIFIAESINDNSSHSNDTDVTLTFKGGFSAMKQHLGVKFELSETENPVVSCFLKEKQTILKENTDIVIVNSGLGEKHPKHIILTPIIYEEIKEGVILISSFKRIKPIRREFIQKISSLLALVIRNTKLNNQLNKMLEDSKIKSREMESLQEEIHQNIEEMRASSEDYERNQNTLEQKLQTLIEENEALKKKIENNK